MPPLQKEETMHRVTIRLRDRKNNPVGNLTAFGKSRKAAISRGIAFLKTWQMAQSGTTALSTPIGKIRITSRPSFRMPRRGAAKCGGQRAGRNLKLPASGIRVKRERRGGVRFHERGKEMKEVKIGRKKYLVWSQRALSNPKTKKIRDKQKARRALRGSIS